MNACAEKNIDLAFGKDETSQLRDARREQSSPRVLPAAGSSKRCP